MISMISWPLECRGPFQDHERGFGRIFQTGDDPGLPSREAFEDALVPGSKKTAPLSGAQGCCDIKINDSDAVTMCCHIAPCVIAHIDPGVDLYIDTQTRMLDDFTEEIALYRRLSYPLERR